VCAYWRYELSCDITLPDAMIQKQRQRHHLVSPPPHHAAALPDRALSQFMVTGAGNDVGISQV